MLDDESHTSAHHGFKSNNIISIGVRPFEKPKAKS